MKGRYLMYVLYVAIAFGLLLNEISAQNDCKADASSKVKQAMVTGVLPKEPKEPVCPGSISSFFK